MKNGNNIGIIHIHPMLLNTLGITFLRVEKRFAPDFFVNYGSIFLRIQRYVPNWPFLLNVFIRQVSF